MAKQTGEIKITGTYDGVTYYQMDGEYYARGKSGLDGKRVKRDLLLCGECYSYTPVGAVRKWPGERSYCLEAPG